MGFHRFYPAECERSYTGAKSRDLKRLKLCTVMSGVFATLRCSNREQGRTRASVRSFST
jgi:hypothetical protein